jgi:hypothetical protein
MGDPCTGDMSRMRSGVGHVGALVLPDIEMRDNVAVIFVSGEVEAWLVVC